MVQGLQIICRCYRSDYAFDSSCIVRRHRGWKVESVSAQPLRVTIVSASLLLNKLDYGGMKGSTEKLYLNTGEISLF